MASFKESASLKVITDVFAGVISDLLYRRSDNTVGRVGYGAGTFGVKEVWCEKYRVPPYWF